jgi:CheY-like chemotaxis protein
VRTVLVVDDEPDVRLIARLVLQADGYEVREVSSAEGALLELEAGGAPDVMLLDVRMPGIGGWELLRRLRGEPGWADVPVVVFTADLGARSEAPEHLEDSTSLLAKPFLADDLLEAVRSAVGEPA